MKPDFKYASTYVPAKFFHVGRRSKVRLVVLHSAESGEGENTAENVANYFKNIDRKASAHTCFDNNSCSQSVLLTDTAFAAKGTSADGIHVEHAGRAKQSRAQWLDDYGTAMLTFSAIGTADHCAEFDLRPVFMSQKELADPTKTGITTHAMSNRVFPSPTMHSDPGKWFPEDWYIGKVEDALAGRLTMTLVDGKLVLGNPSPVVPKKAVRSLKVGDRGNDVKALQTKLGFTGDDVDGDYGPQTNIAVKKWQTAHAFPVTGIADLNTLDKLGIR